MFNVELKFTCDSLKKWFSTELKQVEIDENLKDTFLKEHNSKVCCICDFSIDPFVEGGWFEHVCSGEYLYLENIYEQKDLFKMGINKFKDFFEKIKTILECFDEFCASIESLNLKNISSRDDNSEIEQIVKEIQNTLTHKGDTSCECTKKKSDWIFV